ncbi:shugoshin 1 [Pelodytes ibericus]
MAKERCLKKAFQDSLEDIKERMKEKRTKKLAKVATVNKAISTKVKMFNNSFVTVKSFEANNKALALALEAEKVKTRQAQDLILHLKREHQRLMFEIFLLRRKLNLQHGRESAESKLSTLRDIIGKVTQNLLETANLLGPAQSLCSDYNTSGRSPEKVSNDSGTAILSELPQGVPASDRSKTVSNRMENLNQDDDVLENCKKITCVVKARRSHVHQLSSTPEVEQEITEETESMHYLHRNVSTRRRPSNLNTCREEPGILDMPDGNCSNAEYMLSGTENNLPEEEYIHKNNEGIENIDPSPSKEEFLPDSKISIISSTPDPKAKQMPTKAKEQSRVGREGVRRVKADRAGSAPLKKPWENSKPKARSKSRDRSTNKQLISTDQINASLNSGDAYDFVFEESVHVTPFRQAKLEEKEDLNDSSSAKSSNEEEVNDSLYIPYKESSKTRSHEQNAVSVPLRPRSKRRPVVQQQMKETAKDTQADQVVKKNTKRGCRGKAENAIKTHALTEAIEKDGEDASIPTFVDAENLIIANGQLGVSNEELGISIVSPTKRNLGCIADGPVADSPTPRISLSDMTNLSGCSEAKKRSCPLFNSNERKKSGTPIRKRRCTVTVNYAEPKLSAKLRRGDPFTDAEFLHSPIYKHKMSRKSLKRSLSKYNEAFVGCSL